MHGRTTTIGQRVSLHTRSLYQTTGSPSPFGWLRGAETQHTIFVLRVLWSNYLPIRGFLCCAHLAQVRTCWTPRFPASLCHLCLWFCVYHLLPPESPCSPWRYLSSYALCYSLCLELIPLLFPPPFSGKLLSFPPGQPPLYSPSQPAYLPLSQPCIALITFAIYLCDYLSQASPHQDANSVRIGTKSVLFTDNSQRLAQSRASTFYKINK